MGATPLTDDGRRRRHWGSGPKGLAAFLRFWAPLVVVTAVASVLAWLNRSPWWGWALVGGLLVAVARAAALAAPPDTDVDDYRSEVREIHREHADRYLELYAGETPDQVLESRLQADTDKIMTRGMYRWAQLHSQTAESHAYLYFFSHIPPEPGLEKFGAYHGAEVMYAYDNLDADNAADYTAADHRLSDLMSAYWVNFVRTGDPNAPGLPPWRTVDEAPDDVMEFDDGSGAMAPRPRSDAIDFSMEHDGPIPLNRAAPTPGLPPMRTSLDRCEPCLDDHA